MSWPCTYVMQVDTGFACACIGFDQNRRCVWTAPIFRKWFKGKNYKQVTRLIRLKGWRVVDDDILKEARKRYSSAKEAV